ncbi:MAG: DUF1569 domain-containing protein [Planctomycetaceae bacterium]|jgi:hypothetical protein|nr:DUF1569 domain-containing protein [Planctomycetaceae bacterium]
MSSGKKVLQGIGMATKISRRRSLTYASLDEFLEDARRLVAAEVTTVGGWSFAQILDHLAFTINASIDGFSFRGAWLIRVFVAPLLKNRMLNSPMKPGFRVPRRAAAHLPPPDTTLEKARETLEHAIRRLAQTSPAAAHPYLGSLTAEEWVRLHLRHAELHMSFVVPVHDTQSVTNKQTRP